MSLERIQKINVNAFEAVPKNAGKTEDLSKSTVPMTSGKAEEVNLDNPLGTMGLEINPNPVIPPTPANAPKVKGVPLPKKLPGRNMSMADTHQKIGNNYYYFNDYGMVEKIYQNDGKLKFELNTRYEETDPISYYRYYNYDSNGNMVQEIIQDLDENGNIIDPNVRETIERDDMGRRVRTIHYNIYDEPNCWWEHEYRGGREIDYECHPNSERDCLGSNFNDWFDDSKFYLNGKR